MKSIKRLISHTSALLLGLSLLALPSQLQAAVKHDCIKQPLKVAIFDFAPFYALDEQGNPYGTLVDRLTEILEPLGCTWQPKLTTAHQLLEMLVNGQTDIAMIIRHPLLEHRTLYSDHPIAPMHLYSYQQQGTPGVNSINQLRDKRVIGLRGYGYGGLFKQLIAPDMNIKLKIASDIKSGLNYLNSGRGDHLLSYLGPTDKVVKQMQLDGIKRSHIKSWSVYVVMSPHYYDKSLMDTFNQALKP